MNTDTPRGRGRPRTRPESLVRLRVDVTPEEAEMIRRVCDSLGRSQAEFGRAAVVNAARKIDAKKSQ